MNAVSIILPTRNMEATLHRAMDSACSQGPDVLCVVDDASEDDTPVVVERFTSRHSFVRYVRRKEKAPCHVAALRPVYDELPEGHVIGLAADDILLPGLVTSVRAYAGHAVIFTNYSVEDGERSWQVQHPYIKPIQMPPDAMRRRLQTERPAETGIGSSVRTDVMRWLWNLGWHELGPHADSIGYATAAAVHGALYLPMVGAQVHFNRNGYGQRAAAESPATWADKARAFMRRAGIDHLTIEALVEARCHGFAA